ncbi:alpha/beta hydrolase [Xylocopilactobacillus apicola]|uniref:Esterase n=1 Tax=Xylocopilactobacillus apicola TaxID=2932184 RepID=A0AAU9DQK3_9LACO|nr:alpha/beta hydrolase family protein [Xylocopilactobacillus apicola]BDR59472.1 esterase [Xylocopilactobacillus apicola]
MALLQINYRSKVLSEDQEMVVILPEKEAVDADLTEIPVLYLLHGMGGNELTWLRQTRLARLIRRTNLAVVMPTTGLGWYTNTTYGMNYFDALALELPEKIHEMFPQLATSRERNFVAGLSMGGYGAWKFAFGTNKFSYAASLSGALDLSQMNLDLIKDEQQLAYWQGIFGNLNDFAGSENDLLELARQQAAKNLELPKLFAWIGTDDDLYLSNQSAKKEVEGLGYQLNYQKSRGRHEWYYWDQLLEDVLRWLPIDYVEEERLI